MNKWIQDLRFLRVVLVCVTFGVSIVSRFAGGDIVYSGWKMASTLIVPAMVPILFFVIWLDFLMAWVFRIDAQDGERERLGRVMVVDLVMVTVLTISWTGFFVKLVE